MNSLNNFDKTIEKLLELKDGWYGNGKGKSITPQVVKTLFLFKNILKKNDLEIPFVYPTISGGISLEWNNINIQLDIEILSTGFIDYWLYDSRYEFNLIEVEEELDIFKLEDILEKFINEKLIPYIKLNNNV